MGNLGWYTFTTSQSIKTGKPLDEGRPQLISPHIVTLHHWPSENYIFHSKIIPDLYGETYL